MHKFCVITVSRLLGLLPGCLVPACGRLTGWVLRKVLQFRRDTIERHLQAAMPELNGEQRRQLICDVYRHLGMLFVELTQLPTISAAKLLKNCRFEGLEHIQSALGKGKGILVLAAHTGNWELGLAACCEKGYKTHAVTKEFRSRWGNSAADFMRSSHGVAVLNRHNSIRQIIRELRDNRSIGFVLDQNVTAEEGVFVDFFGLPACTMPGLAVLAKRTTAPVIPLAFYRDADMRTHHIVCYPEIPYEYLPDDPAGELKVNTQNYTGALEKIIRLHPAQWLWIHRRWRTRPPAAVADAASETPSAKVMAGVD